MQPQCHRSCPRLPQWLFCIHLPIFSSTLCPVYQHTSHETWSHFYESRSAWSMDQGSTDNHSPANNFVPTVTKFCVMWEGQALPHDTKFGNCRDKIVDSRAFPSWSLIHGSSWSGVIKVEPEQHWPLFLQAIHSAASVGPAVGPTAYENTRIYRDTQRWHLVCVDSTNRHLVIISIHSSRHWATEQYNKQLEKISDVIATRPQTGELLFSLFFVGFFKVKLDFCHQIIDT